jgi:beta-glucosidase
MNGDMALVLRYRVVRPADGPVRLSVACGAACEGGVDARRLFSGPDAGWRTAKVKLSCFHEAGAVMTRVTEPMVIEAEGGLVLRLQDVRLAANTGDATCPGR